MPIGAQPSDFIVNTTTDDNQLSPTITVLADGRFVVAWYDGNGDGDSSAIRAQVYGADGLPFGDELLVNSTLTSFQVDPSILALADGRFIVSWESGDNGDGLNSCVRARVFEADGSAPQPDFRLNTTAAGIQFAPQIARLADGRLLATWGSDDGLDGSGQGIRGRFLNADGTVSGDDFPINTTGTGQQQQQAVEALANGGFVVAWQSSELGFGALEVRARVFDANGAAGPDFIVNTTTDGSQGAADITVLSDGGFLIVWNSVETGDGSGTCIRAMRYDAAGVALWEDDQILNTVVNGNQQRPSVALLADGRLVVVWDSEDLTDDASSYGIRGRILNADGTPSGDDFLINSTTADAQSNPTVTALDDGRFVVTWQSDAGPEVDIRARIFDPTIFNGTAGADTWTGGNFADHINGGGGGDTLHGGDGNDVISGDAATDFLFGDDGNDTLFGGAAADQLHGGTGIDKVFGGAGEDIVIIEEGDAAVGEVYDGGVEFDTLWLTWADASADFDLRGVTLAMQSIEVYGTGTEIVRLTAAQMTSLDIFWADDNADSIATLELTGRIGDSGPQQCRAHGVRGR